MARTIKSKAKDILRPTYHRLRELHKRASYCWFPHGFPTRVHLENTNACNANCIVCAREKMTRKIGFMDFALFEKLIRECARHKQVRQVDLHGYGEPLLDKRLPEKVRMAKQLGIPYTYIVTNAEMLTTELAEKLILAGLDGIKFSIYGSTKGTFERIHRGLHFETVTNNVRNFFAVREYLNKLTPRVAIQFLVGEGNEDERIPFYEQWHTYVDLGRKDQLYYSALHNWAGSREYRVLHPERQTRVCQWPFSHMQILWDGSVVPCVFDFNGTMILGNVEQEGGIARMWRNKNLVKLRKICLNRDYSSIPLCRDCDIVADDIKRPGYSPQRRALEE